MSLHKIISACLLMLFIAITADARPNNTFRYENKKYRFFPETTKKRPDLPSPLVLDDGRQIVTCFTIDKQYTLIDVTIANDDSLNYQKNLWLGKGRQKSVDGIDFPTLARTGLHSEQELDQTRTITGKSIQEINDIARPEQYSGMGFISFDEDILSVLKGDNRLVAKADFTHPQIVEPLFHVWNVIQAAARQNKKMPVADAIEGICYNDQKIYLQVWGALGWQESIFNDEILGYWEIEVWRDLSDKEKSFIEKTYADLDERQMESLLHNLSYIHTGEMVPFYIMRYGFYEGHTGYRADPISILSVFGLKSIQDLHESMNNDLYKALNTHFTSEQ